MEHTEQWIWLPKDKYADCQATVHSGLLDRRGVGYTVAEFRKEYVFPTKVVRADLRFSGDTVFQLFCNERIIATGPACVGGDFIGNDTPRDNFYAFETTVFPDSERLDFFARVQMMPLHICEYSRGHGGFMLSAIVTLADGSRKAIHTGEDWQSRRNGAYKAPLIYDGRIAPDAYVPAERTENIWNTQTAPIPIREEHEHSTVISLLPREEKTQVLELDKIWGGFVRVCAAAQGQVEAKVMCRELTEESAAEDVVFDGNGEYRGFYLHSAGNLLISAKNCSDSPAALTVSPIATYYPVTKEAETVTSDEDLNLVLQTCRHTLKICRQTHHLDSTRHCEPLACTGDYYIESLMTPFAFGDMALAKFDLLRTAVMLEREDGRMFHTTYSLIWVRMLWDVYMLTGDKTLLEKCEKALGLLLRRFGTYIGENGLIENPPDYMFVDWIYIDGISMHHPPKALGQSCLNMYYFGALDSAEKIFTVLSIKDEAENSARKREALRKAINALLFDAEKGIYFEGLNTPTDESLIGEWMPRNTDKRYYLKHSNILAAFFGVCDGEMAKSLIHKVMSGEIAGEIQPYFTHYLLEAIYRLDLRESYTLQVLERWKAPVRACPKGLVEGFVAPEPAYKFDHSHAWGGTPLYSLPKALMGLDILTPGMGEIALTPSLLGLEHAEVELLTPYGKVACQMKRGEQPRIVCPEGVKVILR